MLHSNHTRTTGNLHEDQYTFSISHSVLLRMKNFLEKVVENIKTHISCSITSFKNCAIYEIMWKNIVEWGRPQMTIQQMYITCCIPRATNTHSDCVIVIAFPLQQ